MSDRTLRTLERAAAAGDPEASSRLVLARLRSGTLTEEGVRLAAFLGDPGARLAAEGLRLWLPYEYEDTPRWIGVLADEWPFEPTVRSAVALARRALARWERRPLDRWNRRYPPDWRYREAVEAGEAWVVSGGATPPPMWLQRLTDGRRVINDASEAIGALGRVVQLSTTTEWHEADPGRARFVLSSTAETFVREDPSEDRGLGIAVREELLSWVLGTGDPLRERVTSRVGVGG